MRRDDSNKMNFVSVGFFTVFAIAVLRLVFWYHDHRSAKRRIRRTNPTRFAFFHPYCSGGGGGERVLWKMIQILQRHNKECTIYTIDPPGEIDEHQLRADAMRRFDVKVPQPVKLVSLHRHSHFLEPKPFLSLVRESIGTMQLAHHALQENDDFDVFLDTTGCAFTFWVVRFWFHRKKRSDKHTVQPWIVPYVHYPTISTDMMQWEETAHPDRAWWKTMLKLRYYRLFAWLYGWVGESADLVLVNSTWTFNHIDALWNVSSSHGAASGQSIDIVYPPCRVPPVDPALSSSKRDCAIVSIGQFRPEKNHKLQVLSLRRLVDMLRSSKSPEARSIIPDLKLILIGSCRNDDDRGRVTELKSIVADHDLRDHVEFRINPPYAELKQCIDSSSIGIHTMRQEHFGIGIVELMASGLLVVAHDSGGPKTDIVKPHETGFLATTVDQYAEAMREALTMSPNQQRHMRQSAQESAQRFSDAMFDERLERSLANLLVQDDT